MSYEDASSDEEVEEAEAELTAPASDATTDAVEQPTLFSGVVVDIKNNHGFIRPASSLPADYNQRKDVFFQLYKVKGPEVNKGETVVFELNSENKAKPMANFVHKPDFIFHQRGGRNKNRTNRSSSQSTDRSKKRRKVSQNMDTGDGAKDSATPQNSANSTISSEGDGKVESKRSRVSLLPNKGYICAIDERFAFIKPDDKLPEDYGKKDVFFYPNRLRVANFPLMIGDEVEFSLGTKDKERPMAINVRLFKCRGREDRQVNSYLDSTLHQFQQQGPSSDSDEEDSKQSKYSLGLELVGCSALAQCIGNTRYMSVSTTLMLMELISVLRDCTTGVEEQFRQFLFTLSETRFLHGTDSTLAQHVNDFARDGCTRYITLTKDFLRVLCQVLPQKAGLVARLIKPLISDDKTTTESFLYDILRQTAKLTVEEVSDMDWNELPLVPSTSELLLTGPLESAINLSPVRVTGAYDSTHEYVDTYFRLLRADCFDAIRSGVRDLMQGKLDPRDMNVYHRVSLMGILPSNTEAGVQLALRVVPCKPVQDWSTSSNLMFGNLLCITAAGTFKDAIWATVANREEKLLNAKQVIVVELCSEGNSKNDADCITTLTKASGSILMVESPTYYRAYQPVLRALQTMDLDTLPFQEELVSAKDPGMPPDYIQEHSTIDGGIVYKGLPKECPFMSFVTHGTVEGETTLDTSQLKAVKLALSKRVGVIQGPPGTGKTFIGVQLVKLIRSISTRPNAPILVLTYKNHALDEFLKGMMQLYPGDVVRIGGRSNEPDLMACNLGELKKQRKSIELFREIQNIHEQQRHMQEKIGKALQRLSEATIFSTKCLIERFDEDKLVKLMTSCDWSKVKAFQNERDFVNKSFVCSLINKYPKSFKSLLRREIPVKKEGDAHIASRLVSKAVSAWMPSTQVFQQIEKVASKLFQPSQMATDLAESVVNAAKKPNDKRRKTKSADDDGDERDLEDVQKERISAMLGSKGSSKTQDIIWIERDPTGNAPQLLSSSSVLLRDTPVAYWELLEDPWKLDEYDRAKLIQFLLLNQVKDSEVEVKDLLEEYQVLCRTKEELEDRHKVECIANKKIIGMTITGASICQRLLSQIKPAIVIVEEAAEVLESQMIAVLGKWVQQLILIGDHNQLPPPVECYTLATRFKFDVSLMERLIKNDYQFASLSKQNRMRPEFAELLIDIYPKLESNLARVSANQAPKCMVHSMYFWDHEHKETKERSVTNESEAKMVVKLALYLIQQEYTPAQVTILGAYLGQVRMLRKLVKEAQTKYPGLFDKQPAAGGQSRKKGDQAAEQKLASINVHTIDLYQGDENEVVIVSLVRSNDEGKSGFLTKLNRRCVSQSRAKSGLYFVGNARTLMSTDHWARLMLQMKRKGCMGSCIDVCCPKHPRTSIIRAVDSDQIPVDGTFCREDCTEKMACQKHVCQKKCQPPHCHRKCMETIRFLHQACSHPDQRYCYQDESQIPCKKSVQFHHSICKHLGQRLCYQHESEIRCNLPCPKKLNCPLNHPCEGKCGDPCDSANCKQCARIARAEEKKKQTEEAKLRELARKATEKKIEEIRKAPVADSFKREVLSPHGDTASEYLDVEDQVKKYVQAGHDWFPNVVKIEKITNVALQKKWLECSLKRFDPSRTALKFHGTSADAVDSIVKDGFRIGSAGMYGAGVYFATDSSKSAQRLYTKGSNQLLLCEILLGRSKTVDKAMNDMTLQKLKGQGYDSLYAKRGTRGTGGVLYDEFVVYDPHQAIPRYIVHYSRHSFDASQDPMANLGKQVKAFKHHHITPKRELSLQVDPLDLHFRLVESQFNRMFKSMTLSRNYKVVSVDYYVQPTLVANFEQQQAAFEAKYGTKSFESKLILGFHGTDPQNIPDIVKKNFDITKVRTCAHGKGIYFSEFPDVSIGYSRRSGQLLLCKILPGKSCDIAHVGATPLTTGYDSHIVKKDAQGSGWAIVIDNPNQILPCYALTYQ